MDVSSIGVCERSTVVVERKGGVSALGASSSVGAERAEDLLRAEGRSQHKGHASIVPKRADPRLAV